MTEKIRNEIPLAFGYGGPVDRKLYVRDIVQDAVAEIYAWQVARGPSEVVPLHILPALEIIIDAAAYTRVGNAVTSIILEEQKFGRLRKPIRSYRSGSPLTLHLFS